MIGGEGLSLNLSLWFITKYSDRNQGLCFAISQGLNIPVATVI